MKKLYPTIQKKRFSSPIKFVIVAAMSLFLFVWFSSPTHAATTVPTKMNFQGRITNSGGSILANGTYNMKFRLYNALTSGTLQWNEDRLITAGQGVTITSGQFNVQLGSVASLPASIFASGSLYFEIELPTPATATTSSPVWTEGPMTPRSPLATSAYTYSAETLDGVDSADIAQFSTSNAFTNANSISVSAASAYQVKNGATNLFNVDTSGSVVTIGASDTTGVLFVLDTKTSAGDPSNVAGAMYYNSNLGKFRCYQGGWVDCVASGAGASLSANNTWTGTNLFQNSSDSNNAFSVQTQTGESLFNVDTTDGGEVTVLGNNNGEIGSWQTNANVLPAQQYDPGSVVANGYVYVVGGYGSAAVYYAKLNADGSVGTWQTATNPMPDDRYALSVVTANGYIYAMGGNDTVTQYSTVFYAKLNADGSVGTWQTNANALPAVRDDAATVVSGGYVYVMGGYGGGYQSTVYYAKINADGSVGTWQTNANALPLETNAGHPVVANGYVYVIGGIGNAGVRNTVYYAKINANGSIGTWSSAANTMPGPRTNGQPVVSGGYVYIIGGDDNTPTPQSTVFYAKLNLDGTVGTWATSTHPLPGARSGAGVVLANSYVYIINGSNGATQNTVYYSRLGGTLKVGGNLDLVGLQGQTLTDGGSASVGSTGGSITAGNITAVGTLRVREEASFSDNVTISGNFTAGNGLLGIDIGTNTIRVGNSVADANANVLVLDTKNTTGDPTGTAGAMYYNSFLNKFRCFEGTAWRNCPGHGPVNLSTATQSMTAGTATYMNVSMVPLPAGGFQGPTGSAQNGTLITWRVYLSKTAAGTAASTFSIRVGTAGTTADTTRCTNFSTGTATAIADWARVTITAYATAGGATTTLNCSGTLRHSQPITGFSTAVGVQAFSTAASFSSTAANTKVGLVFTGGTSSVITIQRVEVTTQNL